VSDLAPLRALADLKYINGKNSAVYLADVDSEGDGSEGDGSSGGDESSEGEGDGSSEDGSGV
jgi:hypothetical protein